jgi:hypothetical protein
MVTCCYSMENRLTLSSSQIVCVTVTAVTHGSMEIDWYYKVLKLFVIVTYGYMENR